ncbi:unnamed protein product [Clonostachys solani]|uniref:Uncharacterized protein n=1 Tax=Clonostachys solani TaxID=160281 RepID=A0A9N9Z7T4_9HYPO|nr:unnamed protein product [Clonostachys solani]
MSIPKGDVPPMADLSIDNITAKTILINSQNPDERLTYVFERLVTHLHDFARETRLSTREWSAGLNFLVEVGKISSDVRKEFILLSDVLGLCLLVDALDHPKPDKATEGSVLGPFHTHDAVVQPSGEPISADPNGEPLLVCCTAKDREGNPVEGVKVDVWETDSSGHYDVQYQQRSNPDGRAVLLTDADGSFWFKAIRPVSYPIPHDGPVGKLLELLHRHPWRPAHMHFMFEKPGWDHLITALYIPPDQYLSSDAVFGVKTSLVTPLGKLTAEQARKYDVPEGTALLTYDFVLVTEQETEALRDKNALEAVSKLFPGRKCKLVDHLPVPDLD